MSTSVSSTVPSVPSLPLAELRRALAIRDLTDPEQGEHALQLLIDAVVASLRDTWGSEVCLRRASPVVSTRDNYDRLGYPPDAITQPAKNQAAGRRAHQESRGDPAHPITHKAIDADSWRREAQQSRTGQHRKKAHPKGRNRLMLDTHVEFTRDNRLK